MLFWSRYVTGQAGWVALGTQQRAACVASNSALEPAAARRQKAHGPKLARVARRAVFGGQCWGWGWGCVRVCVCAPHRRPCPPPGGRPWCTAGNNDRSQRSKERHEHRKPAEHSLPARPSSDRVQCAKCGGWHCAVYEAASSPTNGVRTAKAARDLPPL